jgi:hypothetical protein
MISIASMLPAGMLSSPRWLPNPVRLEGRPSMRMATRSLPRRLQAPLTKAGREDDMLTEAVLQGAVARIKAASFDDFPAIKKARDAVAAAKPADKKALQAKLDKAVGKLRVRLIGDAFAGNAPDNAAAAKVTFKTVHYAFGAAKVRGSSLGLWAPAAGITTLTLEQPAVSGSGFRETPKLEPHEVTFLVAMWAATIADKLLGLPP